MPRIVAILPFTDHQINAPGGFDRTAFSIHRPRRNRKPAGEKEADMTRDEMIRELRMHSASWKAVVIVYGIIVGTMIGSAAAIL